VLERARHKSKREVELLVATLHPRADVASSIRKLPTPNPAPAAPPRETSVPDVSMRVQITPSPAPPPRQAEVKPLAPERYKFQFTVSRDTYEKLRRAQDLLRHTVPNGDPAMIFERALGLLVEQLERTRIAKTAHPRVSRGISEHSRHIPAAVKRTVWERDGGRCAFTGPHGRYAETGFIEYHHVVPFASGGETTAGNLELRCRAHNQYEAELWFGARRQPAVREVRAVFGA
jgi:5-methylcytosine-specific restriction endonuclease McrA